MPSHIPPLSGAPYIITCDSRIGIAAAQDETGKILAASRGAAMLVAFMQSYHKQFDVADCFTISTLQHELMDHLLGDTPLTPEQVTEKVKGIVKEMYVLEKKYAAV